MGRRVGIVLIGNTIYALAVALFILPNGLITGGTTGIALIVRNFLGVPVPVFVGIFNIIMFLIGAVFLGKTFALSTMVSTFYYPIALQIFQVALGDTILTHDTMLSTVFAGLMIGAAIGMVISAGASTGGMDIPPLVLNKKFHIPVSVLLNVFDSIILLGQIIFSNKEQVLYGILLIMIYTVVLDKVMMIGQNQMQVKIISKEIEKINQAIQEKMDRGTTLLKIEGGYLREDSFAVLTVVSNREIARLNDLVMEADEQAFMIISRVNQVRGRGFTLHKEYK